MRNNTLKQLFAAMKYG